MKCMKKTIVCTIVVCAIMMVPCASFGKGLTGFRGIELGMPSSQVLERLKERADGDSVLEIRHGLSVSVRNSQYFRHATYRFDSQGKLEEIALTMREVLGVKRVLGVLNKAYHLDLTADRTFVQDGVALHVKGNTIYIRSADRVSLKSVSKKNAAK